ncbi:MAG: serine/threonine protein kinase, partial [Candidatus Obscuribacterales bacterium]|nr:serine/threonine protein kinase [Candidatus Obscuribacterales bacterium]
MSEVPDLPTQAERKLPQKTPEEITVRYRPLVELERWLAQRVEDRTDRKTAYVTLVAVVFTMFVVPIVTFLLGYLIQSINAMAGASTLSAAQSAAANFSLLYQSFFTLLGIGAVGTAIYTSLPTHLRLSKDGVRLLWRHALLNRDGKLIRWPEISKLGLDLPGGKTSPLDHVLRFNFGKNKALKLRLGCIPSVEERAKLLDAVEIWSPELNRDAAAVQALELPPDYSYTELWLQALSGPPKRERLTPLEHKASLRESRYTVDRQLGVGGQGTAYLAYDRELEDTVVLKEFILPVFVDVNIRRQSLESFEKEARILRQLDHNQIVKLIDFFVEDHRGYLVLEHIDGSSLREKVLKSGALPESEVRNLALQMCKMQSYLHNLTPPVVHRDFTPDNLILRKDGTLKLVDFNVAQQKDSTATGTVVGKHAYLPPEQFRGQPCTQSDIYSLGASLFFLLTAEEPEPINTQHPRRLKAEISESMDKLVAKATAIELKQRYASAAELESDLSAANVH